VRKFSEMILLYAFEPLDLFLVKVLFLYSYISNLGFAAVHSRLENITHISECFGNIVVNSFQNGGDISIKVVKICDKLHEANVDKGISTTNNATIDLLLNRR